MGKRKGRQSQTLINSNSNSKSNSNESESNDFKSNDLEEEKSGFFACYLLTSLCPRYKGHTYIGFTVNPRRRIRQHNGELCSGAFRTKKKRPWEMVFCIHGFPTNTVALQFEWAWQHPVESLAVRKAAVGFKSLGGLANKIKLAYMMLTLPAWNNLNLTINFFSTKYTKHYAGCPTLPSQMRVNIRSMDELPCYSEAYKEGDMFKFDNDKWDDDDEEPEKAGGSCDLEVRNEDVTMPVLVSADHDNNQEAWHPSDTENNERPSYTNDLWDDDNEPGKIGGSCDEASFEDVTMPVPVSADYENNKEETICVSDDENFEQPSCTNDSPGWLFGNIPESSFTDLDNRKDVPRMIKDKSGGEVEVIDVFSPSPEYRPSTRRKKIEGSGVCPEIIDLTQSPICV